MTAEAPVMDDVLRFEQVAAYLDEHPALFAEHPELLDILRFPRDADGKVVDFHQFLTERLRHENATLKSSYQELMRSARDNLSAQAQVHQAVLAVLDTRTLDELMQVLTCDLAALFDVDLVRLCIEADVAPDLNAALEEHPLRGIGFLKPGAVRALMGEQPVRLMSDPASIAQVFHDCAELVTSSAMLTLRIDGLQRPGLLAFGARTAERYAPGQGTELLAFLARVIERRLNACLNTPRSNS